GRCLLWQPDGSPERGHAGKRVRSCRRGQGAGSRSLRRRGQRNTAKPSGGNEGKAKGSGENRGVQDLSRCGPWFLRRLPAKFSRGRRTGCMAVHAGLVQEIQGVGLIFGFGSETVKRQQ